jgi:hypothetical protein
MRSVSRIDAGLPTMSLAPTDHASAPRSGTPVDSISFDHGQRGARGDERVPVDGVADVGGVDALDVLHRVDLVLHLRHVEVRRQRQVQHDAGHRPRRR